MVKRTSHIVGIYSNSSNTATIDIKSDLANYDNYTADDFLVVPITLTASHYNGVGSSWSANLTPRITSYSNGVLTISDCGASGSLYEGSYSVRFTSIAIYLI